VNSSELEERDAGEYRMLNIYSHFVPIPATYLDLTGLIELKRRKSVAARRRKKRRNKRKAMG